MVFVGTRSLTLPSMPEPSSLRTHASLGTCSNGGPSCSSLKDGLVGSFSKEFLGSLSLKSMTYTSHKKRQRSSFQLNVKADSNFYSTLGVSRNSSKLEIKTAYRKLARQYHPDVNKEPGAEAKFKDISNAYEVLSDDEKRPIYDQHGEAGLKGFGAGGGETYGNPFDLFETLFESLGGMDGMGGLSGMGFGSNWNRPMQGADEPFELQLNFLDAIFGVTCGLEVSRMETCTTCKGSGNKPGTMPKKCKKCGGKGQISSSTRTPLGEFRQIFPCNSCGGVGQSTTPCTTCRGEGRVRKKTIIDLEVPAGIKSGNQLRVRSEGSVGKRGGPRGDLIVSIYVRPDPHLSRDGNNILTTVRISYIDAIRGTSIKVPTVDGKSDLTIPAGTQPGTTFVMSRKGSPVLGQPRTRGDQLVRIQVEIPRHLSDEETKLVEQLFKLREARPVNAR